MRKTDETISPMSGKAFHIQPWCSPYTAKEPKTIKTAWVKMDRDYAKSLMDVSGAFKIRGYKPGSKFTIIRISTEGLPSPLSICEVEIIEP